MTSPPYPKFVGDDELSIEAAFGDADPFQRQQAAQLAGRAPSERWLNLLVSRLGDDEEIVRLAAATSLGHYGDAGSDAVCLAIARSPSGPQRASLARALARFGSGQRAFAGLLSETATLNVDVSDPLCQGLRRMIDAAPARHVPQLVAALAAGAGDRRIVVRLLARAGGAAAVAGLNQAIESPTAAPPLLEQIIHALGEVGDEGSFSALIRVARCAFVEERRSEPPVDPSTLAAALDQALSRLLTRLGERLTDAGLDEALDLPPHPEYIRQIAPPALEASGRRSPVWPCLRKAIETEQKKRTTPAPAKPGLPPSSRAVPPAGFGVRLGEALALATELHAGQVRKGTTVPYTSHGLAVAALVLEDGGDEEQAIAALLHDAAEREEGEAVLDRISGEFGPRVAGIVRACSDSVATPTPPWRERKEMYLARLEHEALDARRVAAAEKLHNARSILGDLRRAGLEVFDRFKVPEDVLWYYDSLVALFLRTDTGALGNELARVIADIRSACGLPPRISRGAVAAPVARPDTPVPPGPDARRSLEPVPSGAYLNCCAGPDTRAKRSFSGSGLEDAFGSTQEELHRCASCGAWWLRRSSLLFPDDGDVEHRVVHWRLTNDEGGRLQDAAAPDLDVVSGRAAFIDDRDGVTWVAAHFRPGDNALMNHG